MPVSINALNVGDVLFDVRRVQAGNTTLRRTAVWRVVVQSVDKANGKITASWNGSAPREYRARDGKFPWRRTDPTKQH